MTKEINGSSLYQGLRSMVQEREANTVQLLKHPRDVRTDDDIETNSKPSNINPDIVAVRRVARLGLDS